VGLRISERLYIYIVLCRYIQCMEYSMVFFYTLYIHDNSNNNNIIIIMTIITIITISVLIY